MIRTITATLHDRETIDHDDDRTILAKVEIDRTSIGIMLLGDTVNDIEADIFVEYNNGVVRVYIWNNADVQLDPTTIVPLLERR